MQPKNFFKKVTYLKFQLNKEDIKQSELENIANNFKFKRCKENMSISMGFVHPIGERYSEEGISYATPHWFLFTVQIEEKKISSSEVNYELQTVMDKIRKEEYRELDKKEKTEIKEEIIEKKLKTAPSTFSAYNIAFDKKGNMFVNTTSRKHLEKVTDLLANVFSEYIGSMSTGFSNDFSRASTRLLKQNKAEIPDGVDLSIGTKGEGRNSGKKISFNQITTDDENILSVVSGYDLDIVKLEIYHIYKDCPISYYISEKGIESISYENDLMEKISEELENVSSEKEEIDIILETTLDMIVRFHKEYFLFLKKVIDSSRNNPDILDKKFMEKKELIEFIS